MLQLLNDFINKKLLSTVVVLLIGFHYLQVAKYHERWEEQRGFQTDGNGYYVYLPSLFIYNDLNYGHHGLVNEKYPDKWFVPLWVNEEGNPYQKYPIGTAIMEMPFFLIAHWQATNDTENDPDGYSKIYHFWIIISTIVYAVFSLFMISRIVGLYFNDLISTAVVCFIGLGTNFYYYATYETGMAHLPGLFVLGIFVYCLLCWFRNYKFIFLFGAVFTMGLATIIRPSNILFTLLFLGLLIEKRKEIKNIINTLLGYKWKWILLVIGAAFFPALQMMLWKYNMGSYIKYSYDDETFFFTNPHVLYGLFSARNGLFLYALPLALSFFAIFIRSKKVPKWTFIATLAVFYYIIYSWWCWWYGGSFGSRAAIESFILLGLLVAIVLDYVIRNLPMGISTLMILSIIWMSTQFMQRLYYFRTDKHNTCIHWDSMTFGAYWFMLDHLDKETMDIGFYQFVETPDYGGAMKTGNEYEGWNTLTPRNKYGTPIDTVFNGRIENPLYIEFAMWGYQSFKSSPLVFMEVICENKSYFRRTPVTPNIVGAEWNTGYYQVDFDENWGSEPVQFRLYFEGQRRMFYKELKFVTNKP